MLAARTRGVLLPCSNGRELTERLTLSCLVPKADRWPSAVVTGSDVWPDRGVVGSIDLCHVTRVMGWSPPKRDTITLLGIAAPSVWTGGTCRALPVLLQMDSGLLAGTGTLCPLC